MRPCDPPVRVTLTVTGHAVWPPEFYAAQLGVSGLRERSCQTPSVSTGPRRSEDSRSSGDVPLALATSL